MSFVAPVPLRWVDLDAQGHVNNAVLADYLQQARVDWLLSGSQSHLLGSATMVVSHQVEYLGPVGFGRDPVEVELRVGHVGASRFQLGYLIRQDGREVLRAHSQLCLFDYAAGRPRRMTAAERDWFRDQAEVLPQFRSLGRWHVGERAFATDFRVRWSDLDPYGHVNNVRVFDFFAEARVRLGDPNRMAAAAEAGLLWLVARQDVDYLGQIRHRLQPYPVRTAVAQLGRTSLTLVAEVSDPIDASVLARARTVLVSADASGRPVALPPAMHAAAEDWPALAH